MMCVSIIFLIILSPCQFLSVQAETYTTEPVDLREFGKKEGSGGHDSDDEEGGGRGGGVQCAQG